MLPPIDTVAPAANAAAVDTVAPAANVAPVDIVAPVDAAAPFLPCYPPSPASFPAPVAPV